MKNNEQTLSKRDYDILDSLMPNPNKITQAKYITTEATPLELAAIEKAEFGKFQEALQLLADAHNEHPQNPSILNNRAQVLRMLERDEDAIEDLVKAEELLRKIDDPYTTLKVTEQLGWLMFKQGKNQEAHKYFQIAANLGSEEAKRMSVRCNPYAELCNAMFREAMAQNVYFSKP